jgi:hypothetical protein
MAPKVRSLRIEAAVAISRYGQRNSNTSPPARRGEQWIQAESARHFMNVVGALELLLTELNSAATATEHACLIDSVNGLVGHDVPAGFLQAGVLALLETSGCIPQASQPSVEEQVLRIPLVLTKQKEATA